MAKNPKKPAQPTKKHLAKLERERIQRRYLIIASVVVVVVVIGLVLYGIIDQMYLQSRRPVAVVNDTRIFTEDFQGQTRLARYNMIQSAFSVYQLAQFMGNDPNSLQPIVSQLQSIDGQLYPPVIGRQVLDQMIDDILIKQEAENLGISITEGEIEREIEQAFGYFQDGVPTPTTAPELAPTSTLTELQISLIPATSTPIEDKAATTTPSASDEEEDPLSDGDTPTPQPSPTPISVQDFNERYNETITTLNNEYNISQSDMRSAFESDLYKQKVMEKIITDVACEKEQAWAFHILVDDEALAKDIKSRLDEGEDWSLMASTYSTDASNKDSNGDLGWFGKGVMVPEFDEAVFTLDIGETSDPINTQFGWHIIRKIGHEVKPISDQECQQLKLDELNAWLETQREKSDITYLDYWTEIVPEEPAFPVEFTQFINANTTFPTPAP
jgi:parvulin-like peptidyl-prolyl isomerase